MSKRKKIIVVGGGFAGIQLARKLDKDLFDVLLIDKINHHQFQPLFYQVATSQIEPSSISFPFRHIFKNINNVSIRLTELILISPEQNKISTTIGDFDYDFLVIAIGCKTNFFGKTQICRHSFTLKSTYDAIKIRNHILQTFENIISAKEEEKGALRNLVIGGAGPTGVELAGAFAEIRKNILPKDYPRIDFSKFNIILINTKTVIWAAGVTANHMKGLPESSLTRGNRIKVNRINKVVGSENIFAIDDIAYMETLKYPKGHPQVANVAINQGKNLAKNLKRIIQRKTPADYEYKDLGSMATIGRNKAVVDFPLFRFKGYFAWFIWMFLHLMLILSVRNKLIIFINWAWGYITKDSSLRLILTQNDEICSSEKL